MANSIDIRINQPSDFPAIMELVKVCYGEKAESAEWWIWRHFDPCVKYSVIYLAMHGDKVVGIRPMSLFHYTLQGKPLIGALFSAVMVHPEYRRRGIFSSLVNACVKEAWNCDADFVSVMPNDISYFGFIKLGWRDPGDRALLIRPLDLIATFKAKIRPDWFGALAAAFPHLFVKIISPQLYIAKGLNIEEVAFFNRKADMLSENIGSRYNGLILKRDNVWLNWRYKANSWNNYRRYEARSLDGSLKGIAVTNIEIRKDLRLGYLVEIMGESTDVRRTLISSAVNQLKEEDVSAVVAVMSDRDSISDLRRQGFYIVPNAFSPKKFHIVYSPKPDKEDLLKPLTNIRNWYLTLGDWDGI